MAIYPFICRSCGHVDELTCSMKAYNTEKETMKCPNCKIPMNRDYSVGAPTAIWKCSCDSASGGKATQSGGASINNYAMGKYIAETKEKQHNENEDRRKIGRTMVEKKLKQAKKKKEKKNGSS